MDTGKHRDGRASPARQRLRLGLTAVKGTGLGVLLSLVVIGGLQATSSTGRAGAESGDDAYQRVVQRAATNHRCSFQGFDRKTPVASALIRTSGGNVRVVSFEKGWDIYNGRRPGSLIAVCLEEVTR